MDLGLCQEHSAVTDLIVVKSARTPIIKCKINSIQYFWVLIFRFDISYVGVEKLEQLRDIDRSLKDGRCSKITIVLKVLVIEKQLLRQSFVRSLNQCFLVSL